MTQETILFLPLSVFLNIQCVRIPGWLASDSFFNHCAREDDIQYVMDPIIKKMLVISNVAGIMSAFSLFFRLLLEKKIKAWTRVIVFSVVVQGIFSGWAVLMFAVQYPFISSDLVVTEAPVYAALVVVLSVATVVLLLKLQERNLRTDHYNYLMDLSPSYGQFILLMISSMLFMLFMAEVFCYVEGWGFDDSLYWVVSTLTTIGYGDIAPSTNLGKVLLIFFALPGIALFGATIWAVRHIFLEYTTLKLANQYSKFLNVREYTSLPDISNEIHHYRRSSEGNILHDTVLKRLEEESIHSQDKQPVRSSADGERPEIRSPVRRRKTLVVSRGSYLPSLTVVGGEELKKNEIRQMTRRTIAVQIGFAVLLEVLNVSMFGGLFAWIEGWNFFEGIYFAVTSLLTIGYGDYILCGALSRSVFIWYAFFGIASSTFLLAMLAESAFDQWTVTVQNIEKRVGRYEKKAELKRKYKLKSKSRQISEDRGSNIGMPNHISEGYISIENPRNPSIPFPQMLPALSFSRKKLESESESESEPQSASSHGARWRDSSDLETTSLLGNPDLV